MVVLKIGARYCENSKEKAQGREVMKIERNSPGKEGGDLDGEKLHASESCWQEKDRKRKEKGRGQIGIRSLKYSRHEFPLSRKDVGRLSYEPRLWIKKSWVQIQALPSLISCAPRGKLFNPP